SGNPRESRKNQKENCLPLGGGVKSQPQSQGQDPLEAQLSLSTDLLKSDSDNNNSDECGNILPSDIMEFVLNTPSMSLPTLGQQSEPSSSELLLDETYDLNRRKNILFEDFPQPLASAESGGVVEASVNSSISVEEPYLPLELPSDLSVLTTRSPSVSTSQNHSATGLISNTSDSTILGLNSDPENISGEKSRSKKASGPVASPSDNQHDGSALGNRDSQGAEDHMTPQQFISSPAMGQGVETSNNQDVSRSSGASGLPSSPSMPLQGQKYLAAAAAAGSPSPVPGPGPSQAQVSSPAVIKPGPDKVIVVKQHLPPLYFIHTMPNGVTQKISATGVMEATSSAVLSPMTITRGLNTGLSPAQTIFPAGGKVLGTIPHPSQIHTFTGSTQAGFQTGIPSTTSGLLIGLPSQPSDQSQILVSEAGRPHELGPNVAIVSSHSSLTSSPAVLDSSHGKKRPISRLPRKNKKPARCRSQPTLAPSEVGPPNMTLINLSSQQITASIPGQPGGLVELSTITASKRKVPNIIKKPKSGGVMYWDPTTLIQQRIPGPAQTGILSHDSSTHILPCSVASLSTSQSVLNVVSVPPSGSAGLLASGSVSLSTPVLSSAEIAGPISNLLFKANPHGLGLSDQPMVLQPAGGASLVSQLTSPVQTSIASSICVLPTSMAVKPLGETESGTVHLQHQPQSVSRVQTADSSPNLNAALTPSPSTHLSPTKGRVVGVFTQKRTSLHSQSSRTNPISKLSDQKPTAVSGTVSEAWKSLTDKVKEARSNAQLKELSFEVFSVLLPGVNGLRMLGVVHEAVVFLLEQLYGSRHCRSYRFRFHKPEETNEPPLNPHGSARAEIHHRRASMELPLAVRFKQLKASSKETVGVYRSPIHGRGLFCKKTIEAGEMVIEYSGNVIRSVLTDKREKYYDGKYEVVDATVHGNAARFINHSCEPNCYSRVIAVDGQKHIVIFASRRICCGEELTYDYKFPIEDANNKLPCNCGTKRCRKRRQETAAAGRTVSAGSAICRNPNILCLLFV
ncbi:hypothetical protein XENOCAPTIV_009940, partial [Xenoophorus captivus]